MSDGRKNNRGTEGNKGGPGRSSIFVDKVRFGVELERTEKTWLEANGGGPALRAMIQKAMRSKPKP